MAIFTSSLINETSLELQSGESLFTHYYLEGLKGNADSNYDKVITVQELVFYVRRKISDKARQLGVNQTPELNGIFDVNMPIGVTK